MLMVGLLAGFGAPLTAGELFDEMGFLPASMALTLWMVARRDPTDRGRTIGRFALAGLLAWLAVLGLTRLI
jgi:hypothetical protein